MKDRGERQHVFNLLFLLLQLLLIRKDLAVCSVSAVRLTVKVKGSCIVPSSVHPKHLAGGMAAGMISKDIYSTAAAA